MKFRRTQCKKGHDLTLPGSRYAHGRCRACCQEYNKQAYVKNSVQQKLRAREWFKANPTRVKEQHWKEQGIILSFDKYAQMLEKQNNCCAICGRNQVSFKRPLCVDHNHKTGQVRGLVCGFCNRGPLDVIENYAHLIPTIKEYLNTWENKKAS